MPTRRLRRLASATFTAGVADGAVDVSLPLLAARVSESAVAISATLAASYTGLFASSLAIGVITDLKGPTPVARAAAKTRVVGAALLLLGVIDPRLTLPMVYVCAVCFGAAEAAAETAQGSLLPSVFHDTHPAIANSYIYTAEASSRMLVGPLAGALAISTSPVGAAGFVALAFAASYPLVIAATRGAGSMASAQSSTTKEPSRRRLVRQALDTSAAGIRALLEHAVLRRASLVAAVMAAAAGMGIGPLVVFVNQELGAGDIGFGVLFAAAAAGTTVGSLAARTLADSKRALTTGLPTVAWATAASLGLLALVPCMAVAIGGFLISGFTAGAWNVVSRTARHSYAPRPVLARVNSAHRVLTLSTAIPSPMIGGLVAGEFGAVAPIWLMAVGFALAAALLPSDALAAARRSTKPTPP